MKTGSRSAEVQHLVLCATGKTGLGHLRRLTNIAAAIARLRRGVRLHLLSNAPVAGLHKFESDLFASVAVVDRKHMAAHLAKLPPEPAGVDTAIIPDIQKSDRRLCLVLRETVQERLKDFRLTGGRRWDLVCIPNPACHWMPTREQVGAKRLQAVGWIYRQAPQCARRKRDLSSARRMLVASGGGGNHATSSDLFSEIDQIMGIVRARSNFVLRVTQAIGPRQPLGAVLQCADEHIEVGPGLNEVFSSYDLIASTAGYNSVLELANLDTPVLLTPITRSYDDQTMRAGSWADKLGYMHVAGRNVSSATWILETLSTETRRTPIQLEPSGARACAEAILGLTW